MWCAGKTQRLRLLNAGGAWSFRVWIEDHPMQVIAVSGTDIEPIKVRPQKRQGQLLESDMSWPRPDRA